MSRTYKKRPEAVWEAVKADYLRGMTAAECGRRYDVTTWALAWRAKNHGWRKIDAAAPTEAATSQAPPRKAPAGPEATARLAFEAAARALAEGRVKDTVTLVRLAESLVRLELPPPPSVEEMAAQLREQIQETMGPQMEARLAELAAEQKLRLAEISAEHEANVERRARQLCEWMMGGGSLRGAGEGRPRLPEYAVDRDGRIVRAADVAGAWFDASVSRPPGEDHGSSEPFVWPEAAEEPAGPRIRVL